MPYVNQRWLGGMLTNFQTVSGRVKRMQELRLMQRAGDFEGMPKREALRHVRELEKLERNLGGIAMPSASLGSNQVDSAADAPASATAIRSAICVG